MVEFCTPSMGFACIRVVHWLRASCARAKSNVLGTVGLTICKLEIMQRPAKPCSEPIGFVKRVEKLRLTWGIEPL